jgi:hypothetical protein
MAANKFPKFPVTSPFNADNAKTMIELGMLGEDDDQLAMLDVWGKLLADPVVRVRATAKFEQIPAVPQQLLDDFERDIFTNEYWQASHAHLVACQGVFAEVLKELSKSDRIALRERLGNVSAFPAQS